MMQLRVLAAVALLLGVSAAATVDCRGGSCINSEVLISNGPQRNLQQAGWGGAATCRCSSVLLQVPGAAEQQAVVV